MGTTGQNLIMYDSGIENLKKAAISVKVRSFLSGQNGDIDPQDLDNPELSLDLQSLIDDPNFDVNEGLFPELIHDKLVNGGVGSKNSNNNNNNIDYSQLTLRGHNLPHNAIHHGFPSRNGGVGGGNPLAYMPQPVHGGSSFNPNSNPNAPGSNGSSSHTANSSPSSSPAQVGNGHGGDDGGSVKAEPMDHRLDFNANTVSSSSDPGYSSYSSNNLTSPSSTSSSSSSSGGGGGGGGGTGSNYSPNAYIHHMGPNSLGNHEPGLVVIKNSNTSNGGGGGGGLTFNPGSKLMGHHHPGHHHSSSHHHHHHGGGSGLAKKMKNVDKASDEYKRRRERNNIAVRKSREKAKMRSRETEERVKILSKENERLQKKIDLLTEELTFLRSFFSNVGGLPEQIHREFNKHLETFQHHHIQNGIQFPSFASFKSMQ